MTQLSVVLPCYNESGNLAGLLERYRPLARQVNLELILVDNGSADDSAEILKIELAKPENSFARSVAVPKNIGYGHGLKTGLAAANAATVAFSHADLQCPPEDLVTAFRIHQKLSNSEPCLIKGRRRGGRPLPDRVVTWFYNHFSLWMLNTRVQPVSPNGNFQDAPRFADVNAEPKLFDRAFVDALLKGPDDFTFDLYALHAAVRSGRRIFEFDVSYEARRWGKSKLAANPWVRLKTSANAFRQICRLRCGASPSSR